MTVPKMGDAICTPSECSMILQQLLLVIVMINNLPLEKFLYTLNCAKMINSALTRGLYSEVTKNTEHLVQEALNFGKVADKIIEKSKGGVYQ